MSDDTRESIEQAYRNLWVSCFREVEILHERKQIDRDEYIEKVRIMNHIRCTWNQAIRVGDAQVADRQMRRLRRLARELIRTSSRGKQ